MSQNPEQIKQITHDYIQATKWATLATVRKDHAPVLRVMGSFAAEGVDIYFSTRRKTGKVEDIEKNNLVSFYFQHENQPRDTFKNLAIIGQAHEVTEKDAREKAVSLLSSKNPNLLKRIEIDGWADTAIYKITTQEIKILDYSRSESEGRLLELKISE